MSLRKICLVIFAVLPWCLTAPSALGDEVVAFWGFADEYDFSATNPNKQDFAADVDGTVSGDANLQAYLGKEDKLDDNGGGGFTSYTSTISGITYTPTRTLKWDDLKGGGDDFDIGGVDSFQIDKLTGDGPEAGNFDNDALIYIRLDGSGYANFDIRFDIEGTPGDLPSTFDVFYRVGGMGTTWFRDPAQNNIPMVFTDHDPVDPENQIAESGLIALSSILNGADSVEIILSDFAENGNKEMEIDNIEITALAVPEPTTILLLLAGMTCACSRLRD